MLYAVIYLTELRQSVVRDAARPIVRAIDGPRHPSGFELELSSWGSKTNDSSVGLEECWNAEVIWLLMSAVCALPAQGPLRSPEQLLSRVHHHGQPRSSLHGAPANTAVQQVRV